MKILMLTPYLPYPPSSGGQVRSYNLIKNLAKKHEITLFSLIKDDDEKKDVRYLEEFCQKVRVFRRPARPWILSNILKTGLGPYPFLVIRNFSKEEKEAISGELSAKSFDLIHAENFYVMPHLPKTTIPVLLTEQTILYRVYQHFVESLPWYLFWLKPILMVDVLKLRYWEAFYWKKSDFLAAVSEDDLPEIRALAPKKKVHIVPNGVDFSYFGEMKYKKDPSPTILFGAADFHWMQNKEGARILIEDIWPEIKKRVRGAKLWIVGKIAPEAMAEYIGQKDIVIEEITDSREAYQRSWVLVAPMRSGGGSRTKFFEAMASGLPIITTPEGIQGISAKWGEEVMVEKTPRSLAEAAIRFITNPKKAEDMSLKGKQLVREKYDWRESAKKLDCLYGEIGNAKRKG
ncbi:glycosyltransferase [Candidatus Shapirobacteria bacterium]|nr:glycosyltransferase [Candidatus Shapirobacteria bacterium]